MKIQMFPQQGKLASTRARPTEEQVIHPCRREMSKARLWWWAAGSIAALQQLWQPELVDTLVRGCGGQRRCYGGGQRRGQQQKHSILPPMDVRRTRQLISLRLGREVNQGWDTTTPSPPTSEETGQNPVCIFPHHVAQPPHHLRSQGPTHRAEWAGGPSPSHIPGLLHLSLGHVLWRPLVWWSHNLMKMPWPFLRLDISNKRAE